MRSPLIIGTRGSDLARWQANFVKKMLEAAGHPCELKIIKTQGDAKQELSLDKLEGKGFFTKEIEDALLSGETDIAVHSFKDLPTESPGGLVIGAVSEREDPSEILLIHQKSHEPKMKFPFKKNAVVGTSSARRKSQLLAFRPDIQIKDLRGNVPTRVDKLRKGDYDAILIATAGVERLNLDLTDLISLKLDPKEFIPAPAQGVLAIQVREKDMELKKILSVINDESVKTISGIERKILNLFQGGCHMPVGVFADYNEETEMYSVRVLKSDAWDKMPRSVFSQSADPNQLAQRAFDKINSIKPCKVFVTWADRKDSYLRRVLEGNGFSIEERALIEFNPIKFNSIPHCDWIFFSSKHAVKFFFNQKPEISKQKFGCVGKATSEELRKFGYRSEFIGTSDDTRLTGKKFASLVGSSDVLFPMAKGSMRSIQQQFVKPEKVHDLVVYETVKRNQGQIPDAKIVVFTSPSNVESWFENYTFGKNQKAIAMGDATAHTLKSHRVFPEALVDSFDEAGIARAVFGTSGTSEQ